MSFVLVRAGSRFLRCAATLHLFRKYIPMVFLAFVFWGAARGGWTWSRRDSLRFIRIKCRNARRCLPHLYSAHQHWWGWYVRDVKHIQLRWDIITFGRVYVVFRDRCRRHWPHHVKRADRQIEVVEAWGYDGLLPPIAIRKCQPIGVRLNCRILRLRRRCIGDCDDFSCVCSQFLGGIRKSRGVVPGLTILS